MKQYRNIVRLCNLIAEAIGKLRQQRLLLIQSGFDDFRYRCSEAAKNSRLFYAALERGWLRGAVKVISRTKRNLDDFSYRLHSFRELFDADEIKMPRLADIFAELAEIDQELGGYQFDLKKKTISVTTESITLEDVCLGPFEIRLSIDQIPRLASESPYRIVALEPYLPGVDSNITHPHVSSERLCEGDGDAAIRKALEDGRLCDFFTLVTSILQTYNPNSPYVPLEDWEGISCYDCGRTTSEHDRYYCESCNQDFCDECSTYCQMCDTTICLGCAYECPDCGKPVCQRCTALCTECEERFCKDCLCEGMCQSCEEQRKADNDEEQNEVSEEATAAAAVQPDSVGKADVLS